MTDVWKPAIRVEVEFGLSFFISGCSLSLLYRKKKKLNMCPFPSDTTYLWTVLAVILWRNLRRQYFQNSIWLGCPQVLKCQSENSSLLQSLLHQITWHPFLHSFIFPHNIFEPLILCVYAASSPNTITLEKNSLGAGSCWFCPMQSLQYLEQFLLQSRHWENFYRMNEWISRT